MATNNEAPEGTFSAAPFLSKDGIADGVRAEVKVVVGYGVVQAFTPSKQGNSNKVEFAVRNTEHFPSGWTRDQKLIKKIEAAMEAGEPIHFRLETRRKDHVDRKLPLSEVAPPGDMRAAKDNVVKSLAAVKLDDDDEWTISMDAKTRLDEDPQRGGSPSAYDNTPEQLRENAGDSTPAPRGNDSGYEPAPYIGRLNTGEVNPGAIAINAPLGFFSHLLELERETGIEIQQARRKEIAHNLVRIANKLQADIYSQKLGKELKNGPDLTAGSHTRARGLIFETIRSFAPLTEEVVADAEAFKNWQKKIYTVAYAMWEWAIDEVDQYIS